MTLCGGTPYLVLALFNTNQTHTIMKNSLVTLEKIEAVNENNVVIKLSDGTEYKANKNENGWAAYGTDNGNNWETSDFETPEDVAEDLCMFKNEG